MFGSNGTYTVHSTSCLYLFISCGMKEEDGSSKDAIKKCESAVESDVVFILSQAAHREGYKAEWHYDKICPLKHF